MRIPALAAFALGARLLFAQSDTQPPQLLDLTIEPGSVDVSEVPRTVTFTLHVTDDLSGVDSTSGSRLFLGLLSPSGTQYVYGFAVAQPGTVLDGIFPIEVPVPQYAEPGTWTIYTIRLRDAIGNTTFLSSAALSAAGFPTTVNVIDTNPDTQPPQLAGLAMSPSSVDVSATPATITLDLALTDDRSGIATNSTNLQDFEVQSPSGGQSRFVSVLQLERISGTDTNGVWRATFTMPQYSEPGTWKVSIVTVKDRMGTRHVYDATALQAFGAATCLEVVSSPADTTPPSLDGVAFSPAFLNTSAGAQALQVSLSITDDLSGVSFAADTPRVSRSFGATFRSPSGGQSRYTSFFYAGIPPVSGTPTDGVWVLNASFPQFSEDGTWKLSRIDLKDAVGNLTTYATPARIAEAGFPTDLVIIRPSLEPDGTVGAGGGTVSDSTFGSRARMIVPPGVLPGPTAVAIDVLESPLGIPLPEGFSTAESYFVNVALTPEPSYPLPAPGITIVLPLRTYLIPGTGIALYRVEGESGSLTPALDSAGDPVAGIVEAGGMTATFAGVARFSTLVGLLPAAVPVEIDIRPDSTSNVINTKARGTIPVAIFGTPTFDVAQADPSSIRLSGAPVATNKEGRPLVSRADLNGDGLLDILVHFEVKDLLLGTSDSEAILEGLTPDGRVFRGADAVKVLR